jgi:hypothetical protein
MLIALNGCAALVPDEFGVEAEHVSHISQHFGPDRHEYGFDALSAVARWRWGAHFYAEMSDGAVIEDCRSGYCGALWGPREVFEARAGYVFQIRKP